MIHHLISQWTQEEAEERRRRLWSMAGWLLFVGFIGLCFGYAWGRYHGGLG